MWVARVVMCDIVYFMTQGEAGERIALACPKKLGFHQHHTSMMDLQSNEKKFPRSTALSAKFFSLGGVYCRKKSFLHEISHIVRY